MRTRETAGLSKGLLLVLGQVAGLRKRSRTLGGGVSNNNAVNTRCPDSRADTSKLVLGILIRRDLDHNERLSLAINLSSGINDAAQDLGQGVISLKITETRHIGARDVDDEDISVFTEFVDAVDIVALDSLDIIVRRSLILSDLHGEELALGQRTGRHTGLTIKDSPLSDIAGAETFSLRKISDTGTKCLSNVIGTLRVQTTSVDQGLLGGDAEDTGARVSWLRKWGDSSNLDDTGTDSKERVGDVSVLVETGGDTDRVEDIVAKDL